MRSVLGRARDALQELDRATDRVIAGKPLLRPGRRSAAAAAPGPAFADMANNSITEGATEALRDTAVSGSSLLLDFAAHLSIIFFIAHLVLTGGRPLTEQFAGLWSGHADSHARVHRAVRECARQIRIYAGVLPVTNTALGMAAFLVALSTIVGTLVSAWLKGRAAKMNPAAVFIGLVFWGALWGGSGASFSDRSWWWCSRSWPSIRGPVFDWPG